MKSMYHKWAMKHSYEIKTIKMSYEPFPWKEIVSWYQASDDQSTTEYLLVIVSP
jgi:hypothetical protein